MGVDDLGPSWLASKECPRRYSVTLEGRDVTDPCDLQVETACIGLVDGDGVDEVRSSSSCSDGFNEDINNGAIIFDCTLRRPHAWYCENSLYPAQFVPKVLAAEGCTRINRVIRWVQFEERTFAAQVHLVH